MKEKAEVEDIDRSLYDFRYDEDDAFKLKRSEGLTPDIVQQISEEKNDPEWMGEFRLKSLEIYNYLECPGVGAVDIRTGYGSISLHMSGRRHKMQADWEDVPEDIKDTFESWVSRG